MSEPYSYHTFILPFVWKDKKNALQSLDAFAGLFEGHPDWESLNIGEGLTPGGKLPARFAGDQAGTQEARDFYKEYQYFYPHVRDALYGFKNTVVRGFSFSPDLVHNKAQYIITKHGTGPDEQGPDTAYTLLVYAIKLMIYNTGVALFILECENHEPAQRSLSAVKTINDLGRRINLPFIPTPDNPSICADVQTVEIPGEGDPVRFVTDFYTFSHSKKTGEDYLQHSSVTYISQFIKEILSYNQPLYRFTSDLNKAGVNREGLNPDGPEKQNLYIRPAVDDRMFVLCCVNDPKETGKFLGENAEADDQDRPFMTDPEQQKRLYELIFIDPDNGCTCRSASMRKKLLQEHVYTRWIGVNSVYGFTDQSLIYLSSDPPEHVRESFLIHYNRMAGLALAQRASLELFEYEMSLVSGDSMTGKNQRLKREAITRIMALRQRFISYQSQLGFTDVTSQLQGLELWECLRNSLRIPARTESLSERLEALHEAADTDLSYTLNILGVFIAVLTVFDIINGIFGSDSTLGMLFQWKDGITGARSLLAYVGGLVLVVVICVWLYRFLQWFYRKKQ